MVLKAQTGIIKYEHQTADKSQICDIFNEIEECHEMSKVNLLSSGKDKVTSGKKRVG